MGYAHLVYRGGTHTRLSHVMGATHTAGKLVDSLRQNYAQKEDYWPFGAVNPSDFLPFPGKELDYRWEYVRHICSWAALLHDAAHIPLGHTLEDEFDRLYPKHDDFRSERLAYLWIGDSSDTASEIRDVLTNERLYPEAFKHLGVSPDEVYGAVLFSCLHKEESAADQEQKIPFVKVIEKLDSSSPIHKALKKGLADTQKRRAFYPYFADIVGDTICADYLDYLRRDPTNVGLDVLRDDRVISCFYIGKEEADEPYLYRMALSLVDRNGHPRLDTCAGVIDLVRQRFRFAEIIYYHKTKVAASAMFAKAIKLIGKPNEVGRRKDLIDISDVKKLSLRIVNKTEDISELRKRILPADLLDPEVGDESLHLLLEYRGWDRISNAAAEGDQMAIQSALRGISLLQAIARRKLYKTCFVLDQEAVANLMPGVAAHVVEERMTRMIKVLRHEGSGDGDDLRTRLESELTQEAGWPDDALILYVPGRKVQAKGIATYALQASTVVTLEKHPAVQNKVDELNSDYKKLWRLILLVNPAIEYVRDGVGLSKAIDLLVRRIVAIAENNPGEIDFRPEWRSVLSLSCWLQYLPPESRIAAQLYSRLSHFSPPRWSVFSRVSHECADCEYSIESHMHAALAFMCEENEELDVKHVVRDLVRGGPIGKRIDAVIRAGKTLSDSAEVEKCRLDLAAIVADIESMIVDASDDNVVQFPQDVSAAQTSLGLEQSEAPLPLAARSAEGESEKRPRVMSVSDAELQSDEEVFDAASPLSKDSKIWRGRLNVFQEFVAKDRLGSLSKNRAFVVAVEKDFRRKPRHIYSIDELRNKFQEFNS
ncbi:MAG: hypothetical protein WAO95_07440 [Burkholderiales bacterium]